MCRVRGCEREQSDGPGFDCLMRPGAARLGVRGWDVAAAVADGPDLSMTSTLSPSAPTNVMGSRRHNRQLKHRTQLALAAYEALTVNDDTGYWDCSCCLANNGGHDTNGCAQAQRP